MPVPVPVVSCQIARLRVGWVEWGLFRPVEWASARTLFASSEKPNRCEPKSNSSANRDCRRYDRGDGGIARRTPAARGDGGRCPGPSPMLEFRRFGRDFRFGFGGFFTTDAGRMVSSNDGEVATSVSTGSASCGVGTLVCRRPSPWIPRSRDHLRVVALVAVANAVLFASVFWKRADTLGFASNSQHR